MGTFNSTLPHLTLHRKDARETALNLRGVVASEKSDPLEVWRKIVMATQTYKEIQAGAAG